MVILPLTYLGGVEWFTHLAGGGCIIDTGENWVKQTARNRAEILTAGGAASLTVPVHGGNGRNPEKIKTKDVRIDDSKRWRHTHWTSLVSAYRGSPFFDHYAERFAPLYARRFEFLADLDLELLDVLISALRLDGVRRGLTISENYMTASPGDIDLRGKKTLRRTGAAEAGHREYTQVFSDRMPFVPGLSVIDLLFCEGPAAREFLVNEK